MRAQLIVIKLATVGQQSSWVGPIEIASEAEVKSAINKQFETTIKGVNGYVLVKFDGKLYQCERNNIDPNKGYVRTEIKYHPLANRFK